MNKTDTRTPDEAGVGQPPLLTREFISLNLYILLIFFNLSFFVLLPLYLTGIGGSSTVIGLIMGIYAFANFIVKPGLGGVMQRFGYQRMILAGTLITLGASALYGQVEDIGPLIFVIRVLHGLGISLALVTSLAVLGRILPPTRLGQGYNAAALAMILPMSFAPVLGEWVIRRWGFEVFWYLPLGAMLLALLAIIIIWSSIPKNQVHRHARRPSWREAEVFRDRVMIGAMAVNFLAFMGQASMNNLIALYAEHQGLSPSYYFAVYSLSIITLRLLLGQYFDRDLQKRIVAWSLVVWVIGCSILPLADSNLLLGAAGLVTGAGFFPIYPILNAIVIKRSSREHSDNNLSLFTASTDLGFMLGPAVFGAVIKSFGFLWFFAGAAMMVLAGRLVWGMVDREGEAAPAAVKTEA